MSSARLALIPPFSGVRRRYREEPWQGLGDQMPVVVTVRLQEINRAIDVDRMLRQARWWWVILRMWDVSGSLLERENIEPCGATRMGHSRHAVAPIEPQNAMTERVAEHRRARGTEGALQCAGSRNHGYRCGTSLAALQVLVVSLGAALLRPAQAPRGPGRLLRMRRDHALNPSCPKRVLHNEADAAL